MGVSPLLVFFSLIDTGIHPLSFLHSLSYTTPGRRHLANQLTIHPQSINIPWSARKLAASKRDELPRRKMNTGVVCPRLVAL